MATVASAAQTTLPHSDGINLLPLIQAQQGHWPERTLYWEHLGHRAIREGDRKLVLDRNDQQWRLYNLAMDATELYDLAGEFPEIASRLQRQWAKWADSLGVRISE